MKEYFYSETKNDKKKDIYTVYEIENEKNNVDVAERKCRTMAKKFNDKLAGGYFNEKCLPYNFKDYIVIKVPYSTRTSPYNKQDKFIIDLIETESDMKFELI